MMTVMQENGKKQQEVSCVHHVILVLFTGTERYWTSYIRYRYSDYPACRSFLKIIHTNFAVQ